MTSQKSLSLQSVMEMCGAKEFRVPSLETIHPGWDVGQYPEYARLKADITDWSDR